MLKVVTLFFVPFVTLVSFVVQKTVGENEMGYTLARMREREARFVYKGMAFSPRRSVRCGTNRVAG